MQPVLLFLSRAFALPSLYILQHIELANAKAEKYRYYGKLPKYDQWSCNTMRGDYHSDQTNRQYNLEGLSAFISTTFTLLDYR